MRCCQAQALVHSLAKDELFASLSEQEKTMISERILEEVRGRMMEEIVLLETFKSTKKNKRVFKLTFFRTFNCISFGNQLKYVYRMIDTDWKSERSVLKRENDITMHKRGLEN